MDAGRNWRWMMEAVEVLLNGIGEDVHREGLRRTPLRVASAFQGALAGYEVAAKEIIGPALFTEAGASGGTGCGGGSGGIVVVSNIDLFALCESCFLPFRLRCHVVYVTSGQRVVGLSKFSRVAEIFAKRLQNPQKFADEFVEALNESFGPLGVGVVVETWHLQWPAVCAESQKVSTRAGGGFSSEESLGFGWIPLKVFAGRGQFQNLDCSLWDEFLTILQLEGVEVQRPSLDDAGNGPAKQRKSSCPFLVCDEEGLYGGGDPLSTAVELASATAMARGVDSLLRGMAVDTSEEELRCTAMRYVKWILAATQGSGGLPSLSQHGQDSHASNGCHVNGTDANGYWSNKNGSLSNGSGSENGLTVMNSIYGSDLSAVHSTGVTDSNGSCDTNGTMSNGSILSKVEVTAGLDNFSEGVLCLELDISFASLCEHHLLPFLGVLHVGYIRAKGSRPIDRSLVLKFVSMYSRRLQVQERLTRQILEAVVSFPGMQGAMVVADASHMCIMSRGVEKAGSTTATVATIGTFSTDSAIRAAFLKRLPRKGSKKLRGY